MGLKMKDYKRAVEILKEIEILISNESIFKQSEEDRFNDEIFINNVAKDFPEVPFEELKYEIINLVSNTTQEQFIIYKDKKYLLFIPSLKVMTYIFNCINQETIASKTNAEIEDDENANFINMCIDIAKKCVSEIKYRNDKLRSLLGELSQI